MRTETFTLLTSDDVALAADVTVPDRPVGAALLAHPHPAYGGDRHNPVIDALHRALPAASIATMRFDFRTGADAATTATVDARGALDHLARSVPGTALIACGYSFGALAVAGLDGDDRVHAWVLVAPPLQPGAHDALGADPRPKVLVVPAHDQFCPPERATELTSARKATRVIAVPSADHFLAGATTFVAERAVETIRELTRDGR